MNCFVIKNILGVTRLIFILFKSPTTKASQIDKYEHKILFIFLNCGNHKNTDFVKTGETGRTKWKYLEREKKYS